MEPPYDAIVWGADPNQQEANKLSHTPFLKTDEQSSAVSHRGLCAQVQISEELWHQAGPARHGIHTQRFL